MQKIAAVRCCCCIGLKTGCYILTLVCLLLLIRHFVHVTDNTVQSCYTAYMGLIDQYVMFVFALFTAMALLYLMYGLKLDKKKPLRRFLIAMGIWIVVFTIMSVLLLLNLKVPPPELESGTCPNYLILFVDLIIGCIIYMYIMYIVYSYLVHGEHHEPP